MLRKIALGLAATTFTASSVSANIYNENTKGIISEILTYPDSDQIIFSFENMPVVKDCAKYFIIPAETNESSRQQILSRLLTAYAMRENINIGYDQLTCGPRGYIKVFRVG